LVTIDVARPVRVQLAIYDASGRQVALLVNETRPAGRYAVPWNPTTLGRGIYFCRLQPGSSAQKVVLIR
ncbi:MAG TPA: T9SS type A sorting domain-containing protein, partial [Candidatus Udaeobacter sp.]|nr:T9SS type A sorting domain-containing protein [Candidatus Udaeobacter sp.]